jgi:hypothetical protein
MPETKTRRKYTRKKPVSQDTIDDIAEENIREPRPESKVKAGPKKVIDQSTKEIADGLAGVLAEVTGAPNPKGLSYQEAQSITNPGARIAKRHLPDIIKDNLSQSIMDPEDFADLVEIGVTLGKFLLRRVFIWMHERKVAKESAQQKQTVHNAPPVIHTPLELSHEEIEQANNEMWKQKPGTEIPPNGRMSGPFDMEFGYAEVS